MQIAVHKARSDQTALLGKRESISVSQPVATRLGCTTGSQLRLQSVTGGPIGAYTLVETHEDKSVPVRLAKRGRSQLDLSSGDEIRVRSTVPNTQISVYEAWRLNECVETVWHDTGAAPAVAFIAPHGGDSERNTDEAAGYAYKTNPDSASMWSVQNFGPNATERLHITSTRIAPASYPGLQRLQGVGFDRVVSFHLWNGDSIIVGGLADDHYRRDLADCISTAVNGVRDVVTEDAKYMGESRDNVANWLTADGTSGIQIEAPAIVYQRYRKRLGEAVGEFVARHC